MRKLLIISILFVAGCSPDLHSGHVFIHDSKHVEVKFDRPMTISVERDGVKVEASSMKTGLLEDIIKLLILRPR